MKRGGLVAIISGLTAAAAIFILAAGGGPAAADTNMVGNAGAPTAANVPPAVPEQGKPAEYFTVTNSEGKVFQTSLVVQVNSQTNSGDGKFLTTCSAKFEAQYPVRMLIVVILGNSIEKAKLSPEAGGRVLNVGGPMADSSGQRVGFGAGVKDAAGGNYVLQITSTNAEQFQFKCQIR